MSLLNKIQSDDDNQIMNRESISNEYSFVHPLHALKSTLEFASDGCGCDYTIDLILHDVFHYSQYSHVDYPFRLQRFIVLPSRFRRWKVKYCGKFHFFKNFEEVLGLIEAMILVKGAKIQSIRIYKITQNGWRGRVMYESNLYHYSAMNRYIRDLSAQRIQGVWKKYKANKEKRLWLHNKQKFDEILRDIVYLPAHGIKGNFKHFLGGAEYVRLSQHFKATQSNHQVASTP